MCLELDKDMSREWWQWGGQEAALLLWKYITKRPTQSHVLSLHSANPLNRKILCEKIRVPDRHFAFARPALPCIAMNIWHSATLIPSLLNHQVSLKRVLIGIVIYCRSCHMFHQSNRRDSTAAAWTLTQDCRSRLDCAIHLESRLSSPAQARTDSRNPPLNSSLTPFSPLSASKSWIGGLGIINN